MHNAGICAYYETIVFADEAANAPLSIQMPVSGSIKEVL
jgi:hypothetical protein